MLLEYSIDTNEDEIHPTSIQLRSRLAARRTQKAIDAGIINDKTVLTLKSQSQEELKHHGGDILDIKLAEISSKVTLVRIDQQLTLESGLRNLDRDISRASRLTKTRIDTLDDLEKRIIRMQQELKQPGVRTVQEEIDYDKKTNNKVKLEKMFSECKICKKRILIHLLKAHSDACQKLGGKANNIEPIYNINKDLVTSITTFPPKSPREFRFVRKGCTFIELVWSPPVFDGGLVVSDYEVQYKANLIEYDAKAAKEGGLKWKRWSESYGPVKTSLWCMNKHVAHNGTKITGLTASVEYYDFQVRCCNLKGWSEWTKLSETYTIKTNEPDPPSQPLFFEVENVTSSCLHLKWDKPMYDGGQVIVEYIIFYTVIERHISASSRNIMVPRDLKVETESAETSFVLRNIPSSTDVVNISIKSKNKAGLVSEPNADLFVFKDLTYSKVDVIQTLEASRHKQLMGQMKLAKDAPENYIDTDFVGGIQQRIGKVEYINYLTIELKKVQPHWLEEEEAIKWGTIKMKQKEREFEEAKRLEEIRRREEEEDFSDDEDAEENAKKFIFPYRARRAHYRSKISSLELLVQKLKDEKHDIDANRSRLTSIMKREQKRKLELQLEKDRVNSYRGEMITSSALHGSDMRYDIDDFRVRIQVEFEKSLALIADSKLAVINGENRKAILKKELMDAEENLKDRTAAFKSFNLEHERAVRAMDKMKTSDISIYKFFFDKLKAHMNTRKNSKDTVSHLFERVRLNAIRQSFIKWKTGEHEKTHKETCDGVGSVLLQKAYDTRIEIQGLARAAIAEIPQMLQKIGLIGLAKDQRNRLVSSNVFTSMEEGMDHISIEKKGMHYLYEADGFAIENKYELAKNLYENQIWALRATRPIDIKLLAICYGRLGKLFLRQERFDRAIVEFDRQLSLANEIEDKVESADAYYGIGTGFLGRSNYDEAIRYLDIAQARLASIGSAAKYCGALRGLKECYERINKPNIANVFSERIEAEESEIRLKISRISRAYVNFEGRLVQGAADIEFAINMERISKRNLDLRNLIDTLHDELKSKEEEMILVKEKIEMQGALIDGINGEIRAAKETDEPEMQSLYGNDMPQVIEIEELRRRLPIRLDLELSKMGELHHDLHQFETSVKNLIDTINIEEDNLRIEEGNLAKHTRHDKPFRCLAFSPSNAASNEVSGTATGGVENFIAAEGHNVHMLDYHTGELLYIFIGDDKHSVGEKCGHTGVVTCLFYDGLSSRIFSGSVDETIISWDAINRKKLLTMKGHEGSITCLLAEGHLLVSGSADKTTRIWKKMTGEQLRVLHGHSRSVLSLDFGISWLVTGSADEEIRVWDIYEKSKHSLKAVTRLKLTGHEVAVTCVKYGKLEILSGDMLGRIFIWWTETGSILRTCYVHKGPVRSMQFDAVHIVSGGVDNSVCITDIATGEVLQTLRGHTGHVLAIAFDTERIVSASGDNTLRYWQWGKKSGPSDKIHVLNDSETLIQVARRYDVAINDLMLWNGVKSMKQCYSGMKLIVQKGNPSEPSEAEAKVIEKERRRKEMQSFTERKLKKMDMGKSIKPYDRVHRLATDIDLHSLGNRMYRNDKLKRDLFHDSVDINTDPHSLASRMHKVDVEHADAKASRYFFSEANEDEWGMISDLLAQSMLEIMVEFESYDLVKEQKSKLRDAVSVIGRIHKYEEDGYIDQSDWEEKNKGKRMPLKIRRHFERVNAAALLKKQESDAKANAEKMRLMSRERQGAGLPLEPLLNLFKNEK